MSAWISRTYEIPPAWRTRLDVAFAALGLVGVATPFLPFAHGISPLSTFGMGWAFVLGAPFFSALVVSSSLLRIALTGRSTRVEALFVGLCTALLSIGFVVAMVNLLSEQPSWSRVAWLVGHALPLVVGLGGAAYLIRAGTPTPLAAIVTLQWGYLAVVGFYLVGFWQQRQLGAIFTLATVAVYLTQTVFTVARAGRRAAEGEVVPTGGKT